MRFLLLFAFVLLFPLAGTAEPRMWTRADGKTVSAEFVSLEGERVTLRLENGRTFVVPLAQLSEDDRSFIEKEAVHMGKTWPDKVPGPDNFRLKEERSRKKRVGGNASESVYVTNNFRFTSPVPLDEEACDAIGRLYEGTLCAVRAMPLPFPRADKRSRSSKDKLDAVLARDMESYYALGGPEGSAGVFSYRMADKKGKIREDDIRGDRTIVPFPSLGIDAQGKLSKGIPDTHVLVHEITHQLTCGVLSKSTWANEGMSEYVGYTPYDGEFFDFSGAFRRIADAGARYSGRWNLPFSLERFFDFTQDEFYCRSGPTAKEHPHRNYTLAAMVLAFYFHLDGERGIKAFDAFARALPKDPAKAKKALLGGRKNFRELEADFVAAWADRGVEVNFAR